MSNERIDVTISADIRSLENNMDSAADIVDQAARDIRTSVNGIDEALGGVGDSRPLDGLSDQVDSTTDHIDNRFSTLSANIKRSMALGLAGIAGTIAGAFSIGAVTQFAGEVMTTAGELKKYSTIAGESIEQMQYLAVGAGRAGVSLEQLGDISKDVLEKFGEVSTGEGEMMDFFTNIAPKVGLTAEAFKNLSGPEVLQKYYNALEDTNQSQAETTRYMEQLVSDGSLLIPMLKNGGEGFKYWGEQAKSAGAIMSTEMVGKINKASENIRILGLHFDGFKINLINGVTPAIESIARNFDNIKTVAGMLAAAITARLVVAMGQAAISFSVSVAQSVALQMSLLALQGQATRTAVAMGVLRAISGVLGGPAGLAMLAVQGVAAGAAFLYMKKTSDDVSPSLDLQADSVENLKKKYQELDETQRRVAVREVQAKQADLNAEYRKGTIDLLGKIRAVISHSDATDKDKAAAKALYDQYIAGKITIEQLATGVNKLKSVEADHKAKIDEKTTALIDVHKEISAGNGLLKSYADITEQAKNKDREHKDKIEKKTAALKNLNAEQVKYVTESQKNDQKDNYVNSLKSHGFSQEKAQFFADEKEKSGTPYNKVMEPAVLKAVQAEWARSEAAKAREETQKKIEKSEDAAAEKAAAAEQKRLALVTLSDERARNMLKVYQAFMNTGVLSPDQAKYFTAEVGRENDFNSKDLYGTHTDKNNGQMNMGFISWQKSRAKELQAYMAAQGQLDESGKIKPGQGSLDAMARFAMSEIHTKPEYSKSKQALNSGAGYGTLQNTVGKNFIGWDYAGKGIDAPAHHAKRDGYYKQINQAVGSAGGDDSGMSAEMAQALAAVSKLEADTLRIQEQSQEEAKRLLYEFASEKEKVNTDLLANEKKINENLTLSAEQKETLLVAARTKAAAAIKKIDDDAEKAKKDQAKKELDLEVSNIEALKSLREAALSANVALAQNQYDIEMTHLAVLLKEKKINNVEKLAIEQQLQEQLYQIKRQALIEQLELEQELANKSGKMDGVTGATAKIATLDGDYGVKKAGAPLDLAGAQDLDFDAKFGGMVDRMSNLWSQGINAMMQGTLTWQGATNAIFSEVAAEFAQKLVTEPLGKYAAGLAKRLAIKLGFINSETAAEVMGQTVQTGAVVTAEGVKTAATSTGVFARIGLKIMETLKSIMLSAWEAMAGAWAALSAIPIVGPALGVAAGIAAFAGVSALVGKVASARGGYDIPAGVNPMTQLHEEEMVLPKQHANTIRAMGAAVRNGTLDTGGGGDSKPAFSPSFNISATDSKSFVRMLRDHNSELSRILKDYARNGV